MIRSLVVGVSLSFALLAGTAAADRKVDWSDYLEPAGSRPMKVTSTPTVAEAPAEAKPAKATKAKRTASKAKAKRKAPAARSKRRK